MRSALPITRSILLGVALVLICILEAHSEQATDAVHFMTRDGRLIGVASSMAELVVCRKAVPPAERQVLAQRPCWQVTRPAWHLVGQEPPDFWAAPPERSAFEIDGIAYESDFNWGGIQIVHGGFVKYGAEFVSHQRINAVTCFIVVIPFWALEIALSLTLTYSVWRSVRRTMRQRSMRCERCGYDLRETPRQCPECGQVPRRQHRRQIA